MNLIMPVVVLFYKSNGMTMQDIFTLQAVYSVTLMALEIPTGYFADVAGRRTSILLGSLLGFGGYLMYSSSAGFWEFVVAETILGAGMSLVSGADSAMLYDSLASAGKGDRYTRYEGRITSFGNFAEAFAGIIGGMLAVASLRTPYYFQAGVAFLAVPAALFLREPPIHGNIRKPGFRDIGRIIGMVIHGDKKLFWNTIFSAVTGVSTLTMAWFAQPWLIVSEINVGLFGIIWAGLNLTVGVAALYAWKLEEYLGAASTTVLFTIVLLTGYFGLAVSTGISTGIPGTVVPLGFGFLALILFYAARGIATPTLRKFINVITTSDVRATVLSVRNFVIRGLFAILGPFLGFLTDQYSLFTALLTAGILFSVLSVVSLFFFLKYRTYEPG
jgi:MFS family permease